MSRLLRCSDAGMGAGAGMGVFLYVKSTQVLVLRGARATLLPPFYLDAHGEEDPYLRRYQSCAESYPHELQHL